MKLNILDLKTTEYNKAHDIQQKLQQLRIDNAIDDTFILVEHPPVITMGKRGKSESVLVPQQLLDKAGIKTVWINRGGEATYHGPGQLVGYPILHLAQNDLGIRIYVEKIQQTIIDFLKDEYNIIAEKQSGVHTGVWVGGKKICAIGIAVNRNVTMHGFAFNINTNLEHFKYINPCGLGEGKVTSLEKVLGEAQDFELIKNKIIKTFCSEFDAVAKNIRLNELIGEI